METKISYNGKYIFVENARIIFRNFSGEERKFNPAGNRNFCLRLTPDLADGLLSDFPTLNIKQPPVKEDGSESYPHVMVKISTKNRCPEIYKIRNHRQIELTERTIGTLDNDDFDNIDLILRPYEWEVNGKTGVTLYLQKGYFTIADDIFSKKYASFTSEDETDDKDIPF